MDTSDDGGGPVDDSGTEGPTDPVSDPSCLVPGIPAPWLVGTTVARGIWPLGPLLADALPGMETSRGPWVELMALGYTTNDLPPMVRFPTEPGSRLEVDLVRGPDRFDTEMRLQEVVFGGDGSVRVVGAHNQGGTRTIDLETACGVPVSWTDTFSGERHTGTWETGAGPIVRFDGTATCTDDGAVDAVSYTGPGSYLSTRSLSVIRDGSGRAVRVVHDPLADLGGAGDPVYEIARSSGGTITSISVTYELAADTDGPGAQRPEVTRTYAPQVDGGRVVAWRETYDRSPDEPGLDREEVFPRTYDGRGRLVTLVTDPKDVRGGLGERWEEARLTWDGDLLSEVWWGTTDGEGDDRRQRAWRFERRADGRLRQTLRSGADAQDEVVEAWDVWHSCLGTPAP